MPGSNDFDKLFAMKVVVPYTTVHPSLEFVLEQQGVRASFIEVEGETAYWTLLRQLWAEAETFVIVEQDILPWPGAVADLWDCPEIWCAQPYKLPLHHSDSYVHSAFGCTKISDQLIRRLGPHVIERFTDHTWRRLDSQLIQAAMPYLPHRHGPPVLHMSGGHQTFEVVPDSLEAWSAQEGRRHAALLLHDQEYRDAFMAWTLSPERSVWHARRSPRVRP